MFWARCCASKEALVASKAAEAEGDEPTVVAEQQKVMVDCKDSTLVEAPAETEVVEPQEEPAASVDPDGPLTDGDITLVEQTWSLAADLGVETVGVLLFKNIFTIAPEALQLFSFKAEPDLYESAVLKAHATKVVTTVGVAVAGLRNLDTLVPVLTSLAIRHVGFGVLPAHYDVVGQALLQTLQAGLKDDFTTAVDAAWKKVFKIIATTMTSEEVYSAKVEEAKAEEAAPKEAEVQQAAEAEEKKKNDHDAAKKKEEEPTKKKAKPAAKKKSKSSEDDAKKKKEAEAKKKAQEEQTKKDEEAKAAAEKAAAEGGGEDEAAKKKRNKEIKDNWKSVPDAEKAEKGNKIRMAAKAGQRMEVTRLLEEGVSPDAADGDGWTAIHFAAQEGKKDVVEVLLDYEADVTLLIKLGEWGHTPLHYAARNDHREVAELLVAADKKGKALRTKNWKGKTPHQVAKGKMASWLKGLAKGG
mmetsp:Transcript_118250/g.205398  ORF Transcript_118250/g.205398 Transcript_118250/m.205398 type:complete len:470 (+) Transcript_118250:57-1466(+)